MTTSMNKGKRSGTLTKLIVLATLLAATASQGGTVVRWGGTDIGGTVDYADTNSWYDALVGPSAILFRLPDGTDSHALIGGNLSDSNNMPVVSTDVGSDHPAIIGVGWDTPWGELIIATGGVMNVNANMNIGWGSVVSTGQVTVAGGQIVVGTLHLGSGGENRATVRVTDGWLHANAVNPGIGARIEIGTNGLVFVAGDQEFSGLIGSFYAIDDGYSIQQAYDGTNTTFSTFETLAAVAPGPVWQDPVTTVDAIVAQNYGTTLVGKAIDANGDAITFAKVSGPSWLGVDSSGILTGFPTSEDLGTNTFTVSARDLSDDLVQPYETTLTIVVVNTEGLQISVNFDGPISLPFAGGNAIGPLSSDSSHWNESYLLGAPLESGTLASGLVDSSGVATTAGITYSASKVNLVGGQDPLDQDRLVMGFLDDETSGLSITMSNIPYASYTVYGLVGGDPSGVNNPNYIDDENGRGWHYPMKSLDFQVNGTWVYGGATAGPAADVYVTRHTALTLSGVDWAEIVPGSVTGRYWSIRSSDPTLTILGQPGTSIETRGALAGIIIRENIAADPVTDLVINNAAGEVVLSWTAEAGKAYGVDTNLNLVFPAWGRWTTGLVSPAGGIINVTNAPNPDQTFYRIISE